VLDSELAGCGGSACAPGTAAGVMRCCWVMSLAKASAARRSSRRWAVRFCGR
jgi:hypothetical protein